MNKERGGSMKRKGTKVRKSEFMEEVRRACRVKNYAESTEGVYMKHCREFIRFVGASSKDELIVNPEDLVGKYITHLAVDRNVSAITQRIALCALVFMYQGVLGHYLSDRIKYLKARLPQTTPTVLSRQEVQALLDAVPTSIRLFVSLLYGCGLRIGATLKMRVQDIHFDTNLITVRNDKGQKDRTVKIMISCLNVVDVFKIGKWNYDARAKEIDWARFIGQAVMILDAFGKEYYIKEDLRGYMT
jgi:site-specific recombinase XerD